MGKHIIFSVTLNFLIISSVIIGFYSFRMDNYFIPILCAAAFALSVYYKLKHIKFVREVMTTKANENLKQKSNKKD